MNKLLSTIGSALFIATAMMGVVIYIFLIREGADALGLGLWTSCYVVFFLVASISLTATSEDARRKWKSLGLFVIPALALSAFGTLNSVDQITGSVSGSGDAVRETIKGFAMVPVYLVMYIIPVGVFGYLFATVLESANQTTQPK